MRRPIYTSDLISKPEIKKILDEFIIYPKIEDKPNLIIDKNSEYDKTLLGNAVEILFELLLDNSSDSFIHPLKSYEYYLLTILLECKIEGYRDIDEYCIMPYTGALRKYGIMPSYFSKNNKVEVVKVKKLVDDFYNAINVLSDKNCFQNNIDSALFSILLISNILPLCKRFKMLYSNYSDISQNTVTCLKKIFEHFPIEKIDFRKKIISEPPINICGTSGRPDFLIGETLLEIKTTQTYLTKDHLRQSALYYLGLLNSKYNNIQIVDVALYYSLYGKMISFNKNELFNLKKTKSTLKRLENVYKIK